MSSGKRALVLLVGEVLDDARVSKTSASLRDAGVEVTVACTNPAKRPAEEMHDQIRIVRFPHSAEFALKRWYRQLHGRLGSRLGNATSSLHEGESQSPLKSGMRQAALSMNFRHLMRTTRKTSRRMMRAFTGQHFDLIHCNDIDTLATGCALKRAQSGCQLLYDAHEFWSGIGSEGSLANRTYQRMEGEMIHQADHVVTVNPFIAELLEKTHCLGRRPVVVMNCPNLSERYSDAAQPNRPVRVLYQGRLQAYRGLEELICAFSMVDQGTLTLSGDGPLQARLELLVASKNLGEKVRFTGRFAPSEAMAVIEQCDIGIIPYKPVNLNNTYASPNKLFDYMMGGLAITASKLPFLSRVIEEEGVGISLEELSPQGIAAGLNRMIGDPQQLQTYRLRARRAARERYHWERQFAAYPWAVISGCPSDTTS